MDVNRASQTQNAPQVGFPQRDPVIIAKQVNNNPIGAKLLFIKKKFFVLKIKFKIDRKAILAKQAKPIQAEGT
tara:strand:+ start:795 stop:1013 length:219 start_codon:yes stop_codon:yes gene_type:complete